MCVAVIVRVRAAPSLAWHGGAHRVLDLGGGWLLDSLDGVPAVSGIECVCYFLLFGLRSGSGACGDPVGDKI